MIYLDNAATTQIYPEVIDAMEPYLKSSFGNVGSIYRLGNKSAHAIEQAREQVSKFIGCDPQNIIFTSGGTESNNQVFFGLRRYLLEKEKTHIITSTVEHDSIIHSLEALMSENEMLIKSQFCVDFLGVNDECVVSLKEIENLINVKTGLVSIMYVNNETGATNPIEEIGKICNQHNILFHTDCVQAAGLQDIDVKKIGCDFLSISSHKIHGPKGMGALYVKDMSILSPLINGGMSQEFGLRGGTENVAGIVGFGKACEIATNRLEDNKKNISNLINTFLFNLQKYAKKYNMENRFRVNCTSFPTKIISLRIVGIDAQTLLLILDNNGVCVSTGSACKSHENIPSRVLTAMGLSDEGARETIRISFSDQNTEEEVKEAAMKLVDCVSMLEIL